MVKKKKSLGCNVIHCSHKHQLPETVQETESKRLSRLQVTPVPGSQFLSPLSLPSWRGIVSPSKQTTAKTHPVSGSGDPPQALRMGLVLGKG